MKLKKLIESKKITEVQLLPPAVLEDMADLIINTYINPSKGNAKTVSMRKDSVEQNKMIKDLRASLIGAIKSVLKNYPGSFSFDNPRDVFKSK